MAENYTYIVKCRDGTLYTGWTNDLTNRLLAHNAGTGAKYTRSRRREWAIKQLTRAQKLRLIAEHPTKKTPCGTP